ncbi:MAG: hypothetical protein E7C60_14455 [Clostridium perfringens]|nr:hypothetical protein [Clostridium perfringens]
MGATAHYVNDNLDEGPIIMPSYSCNSKVGL